MTHNRRLRKSLFPLVSELSPSCSLTGTIIVIVFIVKQQTRRQDLVELPACILDRGQLDIRTF